MSIHFISHRVVEVLNGNYDQENEVITCNDGRVVVDENNNSRLINLGGVSSVTCPEYKGTVIHCTETEWRSPSGYSYLSTTNTHWNEIVRAMCSVLQKHGMSSQQYLLEATEKYWPAVFGPAYCAAISMAMASALAHMPEPIHQDLAFAIHVQNMFAHAAAHNHLVYTT